MSEKGSSSATSRAAFRVAGLALACIAGLASPGLAAGKAADSAVQDLQVEYDLAPAREFLYATLGQYAESPMVKGEACKAPALRVASRALFWYDLKAHFLEVAKSAAEGVKKSADLVGADTLSKVAQIAGEVAAAYETDQPEAALGRAIVDNALDWVGGKAKKLPKSGQDLVDDKAQEKAKEAAEAAKGWLKEKLFAGELAKAVTRDTSTAAYDFCSPASVTVEFHKPESRPGGGFGGSPSFARGGLFVLVRGDCRCVQENVADLASFQISYFAPLVAMVSRVETDKGQLLLDLKDLGKASQKLDGALKKKVAPGDEKAAKTDEEKDEEEEEKGVQELVEDLAKRTKGAASLKLKLVLTPRFRMPPLEEMVIWNRCGCKSAAAPAGGVSETPPGDNVPGATDCPPCDGAFVAFEKAREDATRARRESDLRRAELERAQAAVAAAERRLEELLAKKGGANPGQKAAEINAAKSRLASAQESATSARRALDEGDRLPAAAELAAEKAEIAHWACRREHCPPEPIDSCLVGTWEARSVLDLKGEYTGGTGFRVVIQADGTQSIDYSAMKLLVFGTEKFDYKGTATARIATANHVARIVAIDRQQVTGMLTTIAMPQPVPFKVFGIGPGGLGSTGSDNAYVCSKTSLEYKTSVAKDGHPNFKVTLDRVKK